MPDEVLELLFMEKFGWTPNQIDAISHVKMQQIFTVMNARAQVEAAAEAMGENMADADPGKKVIGSSTKKKVRR
jgi:hypothetical protein